jgi:flavin-dependent dehydrogenase
MVSAMKNSYECVVIGGGVAGSTALYHLTKLGYKVALLEKTQGPHHKVCGEFLSFESVEYLKEMGIHLDDDTPLIKHFKLFSPRSNTGFTFPFPGRGISRYKLDEELLNNAKKAGADIFRGVCMRSYHEESRGFFRIQTSVNDFYARHLFIATGKHDHSKENKRQGKDHSYLGFKTHLKFKTPCDDLKETTVLFSFPGGYGGICPVENDMMNFCFVIDKMVFKSLKGNFDSAIAYLRLQNSKLDSILKEASLMDRLCAISYIPYGFLRHQNSIGNVYFIGDQRMVIPSFTGDGMAIALSTAKNCAYEFDHRQKGQKYQSEPMQRILKKQMNWALMANTVLKSSWATEVCLFIPPVSSFLSKTIYRKTRITRMKEINYEPVAIENNYSRC